MRERIARPDVHHYTDYRSYLQDMYAYLKATQRGFSLRKLRVPKPNGRDGDHYSAQFLHQVISGAKPLPVEAAGALAEALGLDAAERLFFERLVRYTLADDPDERTEHYRAMARRGAFREAQGIGPRARLDFITHGFVGDVYLLSARDDFQDDPEWIAAQLVVPITPTEARTALAILERLGLLRRRADGRLERNPEAERPEPTRGEPALFRMFHMEQCDKAKAALARLATEERNFTTWGVSRFTPENFQRFAAELAERFEALLAEVTAKWADKGTPDETVVAQVNLQIFPVGRAARSDSDQGEA